MNLIITCLLIGALSTGCSASNILVMLPLPYYSHTTNYLSVFKELARRGHNVTVVSPYPQKTPVPNLKDIVVKNIEEEMINMDGIKNLTNQNGWMFDLFGINQMLFALTERILQEEPVQKVIQDTTTSYDLLITETFFCMEPFLALGHKFNVPVVNIQAAGMTPSIAFYTGNHYLTSYVPNVKFPTTDRMTFLERTKNTFFYIWETYGLHYLFLPKLDAMMRKYFVYPGSENLPPLADLVKNTSLTLVESHPAIRYPRPLQNNIIEVGGLNLKDGAKLPKDLQKYMDEAPHGVIYFSFGSYFKTSELNENITSAIFSAFGKVKERVLMKWQVDVPNKPGNVEIKSWLPQASLLSHPNCKLFITHGGIHGVTEGFYYGVPMVGIPLFYDQKNNLIVAENFGVAHVVNLLEVTEEKLLNAIKTVLSNEQYKKNAVKRKQILRDRPMNPIDEAAFWIEYVLRHKGASHLKPALLDIPLYQYLLIDVIVFFTFISYGIFFVLMFSFKMFLKLFKLLCVTKGNQVKDKKTSYSNEAKTKPKKE